MLRLRLQRQGKKGYATYRVVVAERGASVKGRFVDQVGHYNPHQEEFVVEAEKVNEWLAKGVQPSATVHNLLVDKGVIKSEKMTSWRPKQKEGTEQEASAESSTAQKDDQTQTDDTEAGEEKTE